jgi:hypothetical protein
MPRCASGLALVFPRILTLTGIRTRILVTTRMLHHTLMATGIRIMADTGAAVGAVMAVATTVDVDMLGVADTVATADSAAVPPGAVVLPVAVEAGDSAVVRAAVAADTDN